MTQEELAKQVEEFKALYANLRKTKVNRPKRNKYVRLHEQMKINDLPIIKLNEDVFTNQSESSMQQQMNVVATKKNDTPFSVVFTDDGKYLINFDNEAAEAAFASMVDKITDQEITSLSNDLLYNVG
jgi:hypothetical protein